MSTAKPVGADHLQFIHLTTAAETLDNSLARKRFARSISEISQLDRTMSVRRTCYE